MNGKCIGRYQGWTPIIIGVHPVLNGKCIGKWKGGSDKCQRIKIKNQDFLFLVIGVHPSLPIHFPFKTGWTP